MDINDFADKFASNAKIFIKITILGMMMMGTARCISETVEKKEYETTKSIIPGIDTVKVFRVTPYTSRTGTYYELNCVTKDGQTIQFRSSQLDNSKAPMPREGDQIVISFDNDNFLRLNTFKIHQNLTANKQAETLMKQR